ncbi:extracellular matrix glycoprotein pherophorin-V42 [Volvox carteri f. nagariensis]|uniref:Extracellular matrix glycoprotein pherophorin-V42 n=1 Tax=Volvox carteri f. nagariensis TaxID=3068 RepID=D8TUB1_VOLCA|nr:extracellular matrix glycoprotein pherophorin-V42 [Volvox carteri f. nagariensis]EFJ49007.1 extracellular matrix glycoprotein pherophorin-V42 [Volvox carteri f. nagariensis]|eukprot:XP_002949904.1 extracellular matrix glycoprotein pherophorin-V42 [Volvox carteri f. nagariensis]
MAPPLLLLASVLTIAWASAGTPAQAYVAAYPSDTNPDFPFFQCAGAQTSYGLVPDISDMGGGQYCFTLSATSCDDSCCNLPLTNIEFNVQARCVIDDAFVSATINGVPTAISPAFDIPQDGQPGSAVLRLAGLGLNLASNGAQICITLKPNLDGQGCTTLRELCALSSEGTEEGPCLVAMIGPTLECCSLTTIGRDQTPPPQSATPSQLITVQLPPPSYPAYPSIPPPPTPSTPLSPSSSIFHPSPSPPSRSPTPLPTPCSTCLVLRLDMDLPDTVFYIDDNVCSAVQEQIASNITAQIRSLGLLPMIANFTADPIRCEGQGISVCGTFFSASDAKKLEPWVRLQAPSWLGSLVGDCSPIFAGLSFRITTDSNKCLTVNAGLSCSEDEVAFPSHKCSKEKYTTPFYAMPSATNQGPGRLSNTNLYCFRTAIIASDDYLVEGPCSSGTTLNKAEIWADQNLRRQVRGFRLTPNGGYPLWKSASWEAMGGNRLKVTNINWGLSEAHGGEICIELKNITSLSSLCLGDHPGTWCSFVQS